MINIENNFVVKKGTPSFIKKVKGKVFNICQGDSVIVGLNVYNSPGSYIDTLSGTNTCDSIIYTYVNISDPDPQIILTGSSLELSITGGTPPYIAEIGNQNGVIMNTRNVIMNLQ